MNRKVHQYIKVVGFIKYMTVVTSSNILAIEQLSSIETPVRKSNNIWMATIHDRAASGCTDTACLKGRKSEDCLTGAQTNSDYNYSDCLHLLQLQEVASDLLLAHISVDSIAAESASIPLLLGKLHPLRGQNIYVKMIRKKYCRLMQSESKTAKPLLERVVKIIS